MTSAQSSGQLTETQLHGAPVWGDGGALPQGLEFRPS